MKRIFTSLCLALAPFFLFAQLQDGSIAPDFVVDDINGESRHLYGVLEEGKTTYLIFFATMCSGTSWHYHKKNIMQDFYNDYGAEGMDMVEILFIEGRESTTSDELDGTSMWGDLNWLENTPYPVIESATVADMYGMPSSSIGLPLIYKVCPQTKATTRLYEPTYVELVEELLDADCSETRVVKDAALLYVSTATRVCASKETPFVIRMGNLGQEVITTATIKVFKEGTNEEIMSVDWVGNLPSLSSVDVDLGVLETEENVNFDVVILVDEDQDASNDSQFVEFLVSDIQITSNSISLDLKTDTSPLSIYWEVAEVNDTDVLDYKGHREIVYNYDPADYWSNTLYTHQVAIPHSGCYSFKIEDVMGNGICCDSGDGFFELRDEDGSLFGEGGEFAYADEVVFYVNTTTIVSTKNDDLLYKAVRAYPNPTTDKINIDLTGVQLSTVVIYNSLGQVMAAYSADDIYQLTNAPLDVSGWEQGTYFIQCSDGQNETVKTINIVR